MQIKGMDWAENLGRATFLELANRYYLTTQFHGVITLAANLANEAAIDAGEIQNDLTWVLDGTNHEMDFTEFGVSIGTDGTAQNDDALLKPHFIDAVNLPNHAKEFFDLVDGSSYARHPTMRWAISLSSITDIAAMVGLSETGVVGDAIGDGATYTDIDEKAALFLDTSLSGNWQYVSSIAGVDTKVDTGVAVVANRTYILEVEIDGNAYPHFYLDGSYLGRGAQVDSATYLAPSAGVRDLGSGSPGVKMYLKAAQYSRLWDHTAKTAPQAGIAPTTTTTRPRY